MTGLVQTMSAGRRRKLNHRLGTFFACTDRAFSIQCRFNRLFFLHDIHAYQYQCIPRDASIASLLDNPVLPRASKAYYDEDRATMVLHMARPCKANKQLRGRRIVAVRKFNALPGVVPPILSRSLRG